MDARTRSQYLADDPPTIVCLTIKDHFEALNEQEKKYSAAISKACFAGTRVVLRSISPESEDLYDFIIALHKSCGGDYTKVKASTGLSDHDMKDYLSYASQFLGNAGNYKSFGDSKFIPRIDATKFTKLAKFSPEAAKIHEQFKDALYETSKAGLMHLGYPPTHLTNYYPDSPDITKEEIEAVSEFLKEKKVLPENTRLRKLASGDYELLISSAQNDPAKANRDAEESSFVLESGPVKGKKLSLRFGDHAKEMSTIVTALKEAKENSANDHQRSMHEEYVKSFESGSMAAHVQSQRHWIKDKGPMVESNIGFIETYRDPAGLRGEWEGFVAMVNKERTRTFGELVESAQKQIPKLPWPAEFEKDHFMSPDFTSLEVLSFAGSGIPAGINIPNYDSIRQSEGFKNVSLGNVLSAKPPNEKVPFIKDADLDLYNRYSTQAFEVQVGLHELLGHGCGKLLQETEPGVYNFDIENPPMNPITGDKITSWYKPGETWGTVFGGLGPSYEECRAECVAMSLCPDWSILKIFGFGNGEEDINGEAGDILYVAYLSMARAGVAALQFYDVASSKWGQAHCQARYAILRIFLTAGSDVCSLDYEKADLSDLTVKIDRSKIISHLKPKVDEFLQKLNVYKATASNEGKTMYQDITSVDDFFASKVRPAVLAAAQPRKVFVQANTVVADGKVVLKEYEPTAEGMIQSYVDRDYI
ncbi:hypothetical protein AAFC00_005382 [Neodothiora populina]|uniref:Dipeptidyl peptidase 3 n=1 Tax=Neodothiora populina TaxID=2781224 RepID=A0ABR3PLS6_9PEZI